MPPPGLEHHPSCLSLLNSRHVHPEAGVMDPVNVRLSQTSRRVDPPFQVRVILKDGNSCLRNEQPSDFSAR